MRCLNDIVVICVRAWTLIWRSLVLLEMLLWAVIRWEFDTFLLKASSDPRPHPSSPLRALLLQHCSVGPVLACSNKSAQLNPTSYSSSLRLCPVQQHDPKQHLWISLVVSFGSCFSLFHIRSIERYFCSSEQKMCSNPLNLSISSYVIFAFHLKLLERKIRP